MILGASHMTLACADTDAALAALARLGYAAEFVERGLANAPVKAPFLSRAYTHHDIAFTRAPRGLPLELIRYGGVAQTGRGAFCGYLAQAAGPGCEPVTDAAVAPISFQPAGASAEAALCSLTGFHAAAVFDPASASPGGLTMAGLATPDMAATRRFWCEGLGYKVADDRGAWCKLALASPVPTWNFTIVLERKDRAGPPVMLDSAGMTCFSHLCSALPRDRQRLLDAGATAASGTFHMSVNGKALAVEILRGPSGELIELLQVGA